jgi:trans-resveratrol di-O-methyltransferase
MELTSILNESLSYISTYSLMCAIELEISDHIQAYGGSMPLKELACSIPIPPEKEAMLGRLMTLLIHKEIFAQNEEGYALTPISQLLTKDYNAGALVRFNTLQQFTKYMSRMSEWFKHDGGDTLFVMANDGKKFFDIAMENPEIGNVFNEAMTSHSKHKIKAFVASYPHIFDGLNSLVDVGGGTGIAGKIIVEAFPQLRCTVLDLPHVIENALKDDSINVVGGDMFEHIPPADVILLNNVLHDWPDADCVRILKQCKKAIEPKKAGSKVIVVDIVRDMDNSNPKATETGILFDLLLMFSEGSKERNKQEWHDLIMAAGYSSYKIYPTRVTVNSVMELYP